MLTVKKKGRWCQYQTYPVHNLISQIWCKSKREKPLEKNGPKMHQNKKRHSQSQKHLFFLDVNTVDGRNPKQPPGMYKTRRK